MYAIYGNIYHQYTPNVSIYTIHGSYWLYCKSTPKKFFSLVPVLVLMQNHHCPHDRLQIVSHNLAMEFLLQERYLRTPPMFTLHNQNLQWGLISWCINPMNYSYKML
jgi:hypothetical protein